MVEPWFVEAFGAAYLDVYPHRDLDAARQEARYLRAQGIRGRTLDLCCGFGRHCLALRELGIDSFGIDLSRDLLGRARLLSRELDGRLACGDARSLPIATRTLDGVVSMFSSFGYFGSAGDQAVLAEIGRVLRAGGRFVLDLMNPERVRATLVPVSTATRGGFEIVERRSVVENGRRVVKEIAVRAGDGSTRVWREDVQLYAVADLEPGIGRAGLVLEAVHGDFDASAHAPASPRQILLGRKR